MDKKVLFTDLDGTLLTKEKNISEEDLASIRKITEKGHSFVVATGRPLYSAYKLCEEFGFVAPGFYIIASNGSIIYDCYNKKILHRSSVSFECVKYIFDRAKELGIHVQTYTDDFVVSEKETPEIMSYSKTIKMPYKILKSIPDELVYEPPKVILISHEGRKFLSSFRDTIDAWSAGRIATVFSHDTLLECLPVTSSKGNAVIELCKLLDIPLANSIACGDEENDISMLDTAGIGVAMKNATDLTKSHANYITSCTNNENGITEVIYKFILN